ncbi:MAG: sigma-54 dependent transcriptional regulator [Desulfotalea sp.]
MIGKSLSMKKLYDTIEKVAEDDFSTVLIRGESGTGKEMVAKAIHNASIRKSQNFVPVNCAAIPEELLESELFGYTKGAFTGATTNKIGRIQYADKGTLFLDEIGDMKPSLQAKLLRVIQEREFEPVGGFKAQSVDTRILAATHCDLEKLVKEGLFREDLYYRLSVIPLEIPPLRHRKEDIPLLIEKFITSYTTKRARKPFIFSAKAMSSLTNHQWQGNVRELENLIQHMSVLYSGDEVCLKELPIKFQNQIEELSFTELQPTTTKPQEVAKSKSNEFDELVDERQLLFGGEITESFNFQDKDDQVTEQSVDQTQIFNLPEVNWQEDGIDFKFIVGQFEDALITHALRTVKGNKKVAAELLRLKRTTLIEKIKKKGLQDCWI